MPCLKPLLPATILRLIQALLGIITLGLSITLIKGWAPVRTGISRAPILVPFSAGIGGVTLIGAALGLVLAWTELLRGYFEVVIDLVVLLANEVGGVVSTYSLVPLPTDRKNTDQYVIVTDYATPRQELLRQ